MSVAVAPNITHRSYRWVDWKVIVAAKGIVRWQHDDDGVMYTIWGYDGPEAHTCQIWKSVVPDTVVSIYSQAQNDADKADFEANYMPMSNQSLEPRNPDGLPQVTVLNNITNPLSIVWVPAAVPGGGTKVDRTVYNSISADSDDVYTIPNGKTLVIQALFNSSEFKSQGSAAELWYDPNGNGVGMTVIDVLHTNGSSEQHSLYKSYVGDGTKKIRMRRRAYAGGTREVFARWEGYTSD